MHEVAYGLENLYVYLDNILVASHSSEQHSTHLRPLFNRLSRQEVTITASKCELGKPSVTFLEYNVSSSITAALLDKVAAFRDYPEPRPPV